MILFFGLSEFAGQVEHVVDDDTLLYVPASHSIHTEEPGLLVNLPGGQLTHNPPSCPLKPAMQAQLFAALLPEGEKEFEGQSVHTSSATAPFMIENFPAAHSVHASLLVDGLYVPTSHERHTAASPVNPAIQRQTTAPSSASLLSGHLRH